MILILTRPEGVCQSSMNRAISDSHGTLPLLYQLVCMHARIQKVLSEGVKGFLFRGERRSKQIPL